VSREELVAQVASWRFEPIKKRLGTLADQAQGLAKRLGKGTLDIALESDQQLRLEPEAWRSFWSAFVHVLRNAVDHGLESKDERAESGKPVHGQLALRSWIADEELHIAVSDDGRGIDWNRVAEVAKSKGLPSHDADALVAALFADGVSTKRSVSEVSGRGVGMGAIKEAVVARDGRVEVKSEPGHGTEIRFSFPVQQMVPGKHPTLPERRGP
jgi:two-component system, chemotaxis family, sensor kinase CheA